MSKRNALGRGLGAYFPEYNTEGEATSKKDDTKGNKAEEKKKPDPQELINVVLQVPVDHVRANPHQPRREFDEERLDELAESIKNHGIIQPITVRYLGEKRFELISGERRLRASKLAGLDLIPAYVRDADDEQSMAFALIENIQREDLNALEVAQGYQRLIEEFNYTQGQVAERVGKSRTAVANMLRLLNLPDFIQTALKKELISMGHARALVSIESGEDQQKLLKKTIQNNWSVRDIEKAVRTIGTPSIRKKASMKPKTDPFYEEISARLRNTFSTKVQVKPKAKGGEIKIEYYSEEDLERILAILDSI